MLNKYLVVLHFVSEAKEEVAEDPKSSTFNFLCIICKEAFTTFVQLKEHKAEAHGEFRD